MGWAVKYWTGECPPVLLVPPLHLEYPGPQQEPVPSYSAPVQRRISHTYRAQSYAPHFVKSWKIQRRRLAEEKTNVQYQTIHVPIPPPLPAAPSPITSRIPVADR